MRKFKFVIILLIIFSCKSVDNWSEEPVLSSYSVELANSYVKEQKKYLVLVENRHQLNLIEELNDEELNNFLLLEKQIAFSSQKVANNWFDFFLELRQDKGYKAAYKGHYYFRKGIEALGYSDKKRREIKDPTLTESRSYEEILLLEGQCRLAIGEIVAYNSTLIDTEEIYRKIKKLYKSIN